MSHDFHQEYIVEAKQLLKSLEQSLLELEKNFSIEELNNVYRYLHTLKGSAGMFGFHHVERLSHELESVYSDIRDGIRQQDEFILDLTLHAIDVLTDLIDGKDAVKEADKIIESIAGISNNNTLSSSTSATGILKCFVVMLKPEKEIFKRGINLPSILDELQELGSCEFIIHNEETPFEQQLADKAIVSWFEILVALRII